MIKVAYRRLAHQFHPDRLSHLSSAEQAEATLRMAELNEAYAVLSHTAQRRPYDEQFHLFQAGARKEAPPAPAEEAPETPAVTPTRVHYRPSVAMTSNVLREFSNQLRNQIISLRSDFPWRETKAEGFDWVLQASFWSSSYCAASRGFVTADPAAAQKFTNYAHLALLRRRRLFKKNFFLLLLPFQRISEPEKVLALCRRFGQEFPGRAHSLITLVDVTHGRSLLCGPGISDKRWGDLLQRLGFSRQ